MKQQFYLTTLLLLIFITEGICTECVYEEIEYYLNKLEEIFQATCYEASSGLSPNLNHENATRIEVLRITENSTIQHLQPTSTLSTLTELRELRLRSAKIEEMSPGVFDNLDKLTDLDLSYNLIECIPVGVFNKLVKLRELNLSKNRLSKISAGVFDNLKSLNWLYLSENLITRLDDGSFSDLVSLRLLRLQGNKIRLFQEGLFGKLTNLTLLDVSNNPLDEIQDVGFNGPELTVTATRTNLKKFDVNISRSSVGHFELSEGQLEEFDFANLNPTNYFIDLSNNRLKIVKNLQSATANTINLDNNNLTEIESISPDTVGLFLQHNQITQVAKIENASNYQMMFLDLSFNQLESATCFGLPRLIDLKLQHNNIIAIAQNDFTGCPTLYTLNLAFNRIKTIEANAFKSLNGLQDLRLTNNRLKSLNPESFVGLKSLVVLYFDNNKISSLDVEKLSESVAKLDRVKIGENSIKCEDLYSITRSLKQHNVRIFDEDSENTILCIQN